MPARTTDPIARRWAEELSRELGLEVSLTFGRARRNVIVARRRGEKLELRLSAPFLDAPAEVKQALTAWLKNGKRARAACALLDAWIADLAQELGPPRPRAVRIRQRGEHHDLGELARELLELEFSTELPPETAQRVTWGRHGTRPARRSIRLGSYDAESSLVRIHPVLDQASVPRFFVRYVLFHELLHAALDERAGHGERRDAASPRRRVAHHGPAFQRRESEYVEYERALRWQEKHLTRLMRSTRTKRGRR